MYGYSGYGTNAYASERQSIIEPLVKLGVQIVENTYGIVRTVANGYNRAVALMNTYGITAPVLLRFRNQTLTNPETNQRTLEL